MKKIIYIIIGLFCFSAIQAQGLGSKNKVRKLDALETIGKTGTGTLGIKYSYLYFYTAGGYLNFSSTTGSDGYGFRATAGGTMQVKNSGGPWANIAGASGSAGGWTDDGAIVRLTTIGDAVGIGKASSLGGKLHVEESADEHKVLLRCENPNTGTSSAAGINIIGQGNNWQIVSYGDNHATMADLNRLFSSSTGTDISLDVGTLGKGIYIKTSGNIGIGTTDPVNLLNVDGACNFFADSSSVNDDWGFVTTGLEVLTTGMSIYVQIAVVNTDGATLQINALGAKAVHKLHNQALATGDVEVGQILHLVYDGTDWQMLSQLAQ